MRNKNVFEECTSGEEYIQLMYEKMDENGVVITPGWYFMEEWEHQKRCTLRWSKEDCLAIAGKFTRLKKLLTAFARESLREDAQVLQLVLNEEAFAVWNTYLRPLDLSEFDMDAIQEIDERTMCEMPLTPEEEALFARYEQAIRDQVAQRMGSRLCAYEQYMRAKRYCKLLELNAPEIVCQNEEKYLAAAMVCHAFGVKIETV